MNGFIISIENGAVHAIMANGATEPKSVVIPITKNVRTSIDAALDELIGKRKETGFTGDVVCVKTTTGYFTVGRIYHVANGVIIADNGLKMPTDYEDEVVDGFNLQTLEHCLGCEFLEIEE